MPTTWITHYSSSILPSHVRLWLFPTYLLVAKNLCYSSSLIFQFHLSPVIGINAALGTFDNDVCVRFGPVYETVYAPAMKYNSSIPLETSQPETCCASVAAVGGPTIGTRC